MKTLFLAFGTLFSGSLVAQDTLTLKSGEILHGEVLSISDDATVSFKHPAAQKPLLVDAKQTKRLDLKSSIKQLTAKPEAMMTLRNGDSIPCRITSIGKETVSVSSMMMGDFQVKRDLINDISFGASVFYPVYKFSHEQKPFTHSNAGWIVRNNALESHKKSFMWEKMDIGANYILKAQVEWVGNPQITFYLGAKRPAIDRSSNRFQLTLQNSGSSLSLYNPPHRTEVRKINKAMRNYPKKKVDLEVWVSGVNDSVTIFFDGKKIQTLSFSTSPKMGEFIGIQNSSSSGKHILRNLEVITWDGKQKPKSHYSANNNSSDVIVARNETTTSGPIITREQNGSLRFVQKYPLAESGEAVFSATDIHAIIFANNSKNKPSKLRPSGLEGGSRLKLSNIRLQDNLIIADHEILGSIKIPKKFLSYLELNN